MGNSAKVYLAALKSCPKIPAIREDHQPEIKRMEIVSMKIILPVVK